MDTLPLMEAFYTIQGEGYHQGKAAIFIRLAGCDVGCHWCDVKESWNAQSYPGVPVDQIADMVSMYKSELVVVTGGEPLMYDLGDLTAVLHAAGLKTHLETSGAHPLTGNWDWICLSPKKIKQSQDSIYTKADELKVIIFNKSDFRWAESCKEKVQPACKLFLQPEWERSDTVLPMMVDYVKEHPEWEISLQTHKFMKIP
jgi:organic radical activating enzyme